MYANQGVYATQFGRRKQLAISGGNKPLFPCSLFQVVFTPWFGYMKITVTEISHVIESKQPWLVLGCGERPFVELLRCWCWRLPTVESALGEDDNARVDVPVTGNRNLRAFEDQILKGKVLLNWTGWTRFHQRWGKNDRRSVQFEVRSPKWSNGNGKSSEHWRIDYCWTSDRHRRAEVANWVSL